MTAKPTHLKLYDFWRSSAGYRVRIGLNLKRLAAERLPIDLREGEQRSPAYRSTNAQGLVPTLCHSDFELGQSLAILEYLEEQWPSPALLPQEASSRALVREMAMVIACDIHPLNNLRVLNAVRDRFGADEETVEEWACEWISAGFAALEVQAERRSASGRFCYGDSVSLADICLVPQVYSARRFGCGLDAFPTLRSIDSHLRSLPPFAEAAPELAMDAPRCA